MQIEIEVLPGPRLRALLVNDSYAPDTVLRNSFVGPSIAGMAPSVEATFGGSDEPVTLHPFTFYGREREYAGLPAGEYRVSATYTDESGATIAAETVLTVDVGTG